MEALPRARYLLKLTGGETSDVESLASYVAGKVEKQGMQCSVAGRCITVCVADSATLLEQASTADLGVVLSSSPSLLYWCGQAEKMRWIKPLKNSDEVIDIMFKF